MKKCLATFIIIMFLFPGSGNAVLQALSDKEMNNVTAQAGFSNLLSFEEAFSELSKAIKDKGNNQQISFEEAFLNTSLALADNNANGISFTDAFNDKPMVKDGKITIDRNVNLNFEMKNVSFDQVFTCMTGGVNLGIGKIFGLDQAKTDITVTGNLRIVTTFGK